MIITIRHIVINIFQTEHFSTVKFAMGYGEKYVFFFVVSKSLKVWKKSWKNWTELP